MTPETLQEARAIQQETRIQRMRSGHSRRFRIVYEKNSGLILGQGVVFPDGYTVVRYTYSENMSCLANDTSPYMLDSPEINNVGVLEFIDPEEEL